MKTERAKYERPDGVRSPLKAIRAKCLDCTCGQHNEIKLCPCKECPFYAYRFGRRPKGEGTGIGEELCEENSEPSGVLSEDGASV